MNDTMRDLTAEELAALTAEDEELDELWEEQMMKEMSDEDFMAYLDARKKSQKDAE